MGIMGNTVSLAEFQVIGQIPEDGLESWLASRLKRGAFRPIDDVSAEKSEGFTGLDDMNAIDFDDFRGFWRPPYVCLSFRHDERKVPRVLLKNRLDLECRRWLAEHPNLNWVPRERKLEMREMLHQALLSKTLPTPQMLDVVWNVEQKTVFMSTLATNRIDAVEKLFSSTFDGLSLLSVYPFYRAQRVLPAKRHRALAQHNQAASDHVVDLIKDNRWLGQEFLLWMIYRSEEEDGVYSINQEGPALEGEGFVAHADSRVVAAGAVGEGERRITYVGPMEKFKELRAALRLGHAIGEATLYMEKGEDVWAMTLKGETFHFTSYKTPKVHVEKDELTDERDERDAVFYERMHLVESGLQMFDSLLSHFLRARLDTEWKETAEAIQKWCRSK